MNIFLSDFLNYVKTLRNMLEDFTLDQFKSDCEQCSKWKF